ncbi:PREDICTED: uncharacterized protein LOC106314643 [Brassica oleracea var. oleracea]|uniref:uncharacterized protein LOC106314643 n=1 Tax=Brassica oleracea var. oleracea TaxID=109376 RepID=UPI0006A74BDC|nr:PREDICTED: uncharacterized protein LOC106314643 [Brassica oleracea var. oleracea]
MDPPAVNLFEELYVYAAAHSIKHDKNPLVSYRFSLSSAPEPSAPPPLTGSQSSSGPVELQGTMSNHVRSLRGKNLAGCDIPGSPEESYKMMYNYLYMLEQVNPGTKACVKLDEGSKFKYLFVALGACIEEFAVMRKVIVVDVTWLKNGYGGVLVFAKAQDPNCHAYPLANRILISAIANVFPQAHHGHCLWHLKENVKGHACSVKKDIVGHRFMELGRYYTEADFKSAYDSFKISYPSAYKYNMDTSNSVESMKNMLKEAMRWDLIPMLDYIIGKISDWFNQNQKDAVAGSIDSKLVPLVELRVRELDSYEFEYEITDTEGKMFLASLVGKGCTCKVWDYEKFPCLHGLAAYINFTTNVGRRLHIHELCSEYYWSELWAMAYSKTLYVVPDRSSWNVPDYIKEVKIMPQDCIAREGKKRVRS